MSHRLRVQNTSTGPTGQTVVTFGCTCGEYRDDRTVGATAAEARNRAREHVRSHARITAGTILPL